MRSILCLTILVVSAGSVLAVDEPGPSPVFDWTAYPEVAGPDLVNPAGFGFLRDLQLGIGYAGSDSAFEGFDRISLAVPGAGLSGWWEDDLDMRKFTLSSGFDILEGTASLGVGYTWFDPTVRNSPFSGGDLFTFGMLVRPLDWLSMGMVRRGGVDLKGDDDVDPSYRAGVGLRPFGSRLTVTVDLETGDDFEDYYLSAGMEYRPIEGLALRADVGEDRVGLGLEAGLGGCAVSAGAVSDQDYEYSSSRGELVFLASPGEDLFRPRGVLVRLRADGWDELRQRPFLGSVQPCFTDIALLLLRLAGDDGVSGVLVDIRHSDLSPARSEELRYLLERFSNAGKGVWFYIEDGAGDEYYLASMGDGIWIHPAGDVSFMGVSSQAFFLRDFLDRLGIYPEFLHIGEFKSASDMLTRSDMSESQRIATTALIESFQEELVQGVSRGRDLEPSQISEMMAAGPYSAGMALDEGLVDGICHLDQVPEEIGGGMRVVDLWDYAAAMPSEEEWGPKGHIAVVVATGSIMRGESGSSFPMGRVMGSESVCDALEHAASQPGVRAIVLRIDSGGGDALASSDMHRKVQQIREQVPVIVSMGDVAASGGYYMACGADRVFADRMTLTGSIGIISGKFVFGDMLDSLGIAHEEIETGPMSAMYSPFQRYTDEERARAMELLQDGYDLFVNTVAEGRGMTYDEVDSVARGRIWSGRDAMGIGLVDELGGVADAVMYAAGMTGMDGTEVPEVRVYPSPDFPGTMSVPGFGVSEDVLEYFGEQRMLYLMQPMVLD